MTTVRRPSSTSLPKTAPHHAKKVATEAKTQTPAGWAAQPKTPPARATTGTSTGGSALPPELLGSAQVAAAGLAPKLGAVSAAPLLKSLGDGKATIDIPLKAGEYHVKGVPFTVKPGTVVHVQAQVKNGELVPVGNGNPGTKVTVDPPLDLPLWVTGQGVELTGNDAQQKFNVELGGMFDLHVKAKPLSEMLAGSGKPSTTPSGVSDLLGQMVDLDHTTVNAQVNLKGSTVDVGGAKVKIDPSTTFTVKGDGTQASVSGHVQLDGFGLNQGGVKLDGAGGQADLSTRLTRTATGYDVDSHLTGLKLDVQELSTSHASATLPGKVDQLELGPTHITDGEVSLKTKLGLDGLKLTGVKEEAVGLKLTGDGVIKKASLTVKDARDAASLDLSGRFSGTLETGPGGVKVDAQVTGAHVDVGDLQEKVQGNSVSIDHARADGDLHVKSDAKAGQLSIDGEAKNIDIVVNDFRGGTAQVKADLGRTSVTGSGKFHVGKDGVSASGSLKGQATIDDASFKDGKGHAATLGSSTVSGELQQLNLGKGAPNLTLKNVAVDLDVKSASLDVGQAQVRGGGRLQGTANVTLDAKGLSLDGATQVSLKLDDGKLHSSTVDLDLARGSGADLTINQLQLGRTTKVSVGPGSKLDAVLDGGSLQVGGQKVTLEKGGRAAFEVKNVTVDGNQRQLRGSLQLDAKVKGDAVKLDQVSTAGVKLHPTDVEGRVKISIADAQLSQDRLTFNGGNVAVDVKVGKYVGADIPGQVKTGTLQAPVAVASVDDVKGKTAAQLAGITPPPADPAQPVDALRLLKSGEMKVEVPLSGALHAAGIDVLKFPPGSKLDLSLGVKDGKIVAGDTRATLSGGVKALGVEVTGMHVDANLRIHADLKIAGRAVSVPLPGVQVPPDMEHLADLASRSGKKPSSSRSGFDPKNLFDLGHAQLDVSNATFSAGKVGLPGGSIDLAEGSKLSFHGTPMAGSLTGSVGMSHVQLTQDSLAMAGRDARADLSVNWHREGNAGVVDSSLANLSMTSDYVVRKDGKTGDYVSLGQGKVSGANFAVKADVAVDANGLPVSGAKPKVDDINVSVRSFSGDLKAARVTSPMADKPGVAQLGHSHVDGAVSFSTQAGLTLKGKVDQVDAELSGVHLEQKGQKLNLEHARLQGQAGTVEMGGGRMAFDARQLAWDVTASQLDAGLPTAALKANQTHITGEGHFAYDSGKDLEVDGQLHIDGQLAGSAQLGGAPAKHVSVKPSGVAVRR